MTPNATTGADADRLRSAARRQRWAVAVLLTIVFLFLAAIAATVLWLRHEAMLSDARRRAESLADILSQEFVLRIDAIKSALTQLADHDRQIGGPEAPYDQWLPVLGATLSGLKGIDSLSITNAKGVVTYSTRTDTIGQSQADKPIYNALKADPMSDALVAGPPYRSPFDTTMLVPLGHVLRTPNGDFEGMLIATLAPAQLRDFYRSLAVGESSVVWVLHVDGETLVREPPLEDPLEPPGPAIPAEEANGGSSLGPLEPGGPDYLTVLRNGDGLRPGVAISLAVDDLAAAWRKEVRAALVLLAATGALLLIGGIAIAWTTRSAFRPSSGSPPRP